MTGTAVVTGGGRGIGAAVSRRCASAGLDVAVAYRADRDAAEMVAADCRTAGVRALAIRADVAVEADLVALFDVAVAELGPVTAVVSNAGSVPSQQRVEEMDAARIDAVLGVNLRGAILCAREAVRRMSTRYGGPGGCLVQVSSRAAVLGGTGEWVDYAAAKAGVDALTVGLAKEVVDDGVRVNSVRPGLIESDFHAAAGEPGRATRMAPRIPMKRAGTPDEVAAAVGWLLSAEASYVTGAILDVSGGR